MRENIEKSPRADYEVGYGRPPVHSRFRKGQSGNPRGRRSPPLNRRAVSPARDRVA